MNNLYYSADADAPFVAVMSLPADYAVDARSEKFLEFQRLAMEWKTERGARSSITESAMLPSYQSIIGMGPGAIEPIISELKANPGDPDQWFWALRFVAKADPVDPNDRGDYAKMAQAWIKWAEDNGYAG